MNRHWLSTLSLALAALAFAAGPSWARGHGSGGGSSHASGGGARASSGAHWSGGGGGHWSGGRGYEGRHEGFGRGFGYYGFGYPFYGFGYPGYYGYGYPWYGGYGSFYWPRRYLWSDFDSGYAPDYYYSSPGYGYVPDSSYAPPASDYYSSSQATAQPGATQPRLDDNAVLIGVRVPASAEIWFDGDKTTQTGTFRQFISPPLETRQKYTYEIKARWMANGKEVVRVRNVNVYAGDRLMVNMMEAQPKKPKKESLQPKKPASPPKPVAVP